MGLMRDIFGLGKAVKDMAEIFVVNKTENANFEHLEHSAALEQFSSEFGRARGNWFNNFVDGLNRLPRPVLALGTVGLFVFAMVDPIVFSARMSGLDTIPRVLWWLLGAIVSFYFGVRELHYVRKAKPETPINPVGLFKPTPISFEDNAAVADWLQTRKEV
jgi:hypothetical protein